MSSAPQPLSKGEKRLLFFSVLFVLLAGGIAYWQFVANALPALSIPTPAMPSPNARDIYLHARSLKVQDLIFGSGPTARRVGIDDVYDCIRGGKIVRPSHFSGATPRLADMQALMAKNAPVFAEVHRGFAFDCRMEPVRSMSQGYPEYGKFRDLARVMQADADVHCASGHWDAGADRYLDIMRVGEDIPRGGPLIAMLVGVAIQAMGRAEIWYTVDCVSPATARRAARRLEEMAARRVSYAEVMQEEQWSTQAGLLEILRRPRWRQEMVQGFANDRLSAARIYCAGRRALLLKYTGYTDRLIAEARRPYAVANKSLPLPGDPVCQMMAPIFDKAYFKYAQNRTMNDLLMLRFALRAYRAELGAYPATLADLVPAYLKAVPDDPYAPSGPFRYSATGNTYRLYSLGPDGKDDGGTPCADGKLPPATATGRSAPIQYSSTGDIVAGVHGY